MLSGPRHKGFATMRMLFYHPPLGIWCKGMLLLLLFRHSAMCSIAQEEHLATSPVIGDKAPPATQDSSEVARSLKRYCYPHTGNGGNRWCLSSSLSLSVGFSIQDEAMDVARSAPQGAHYHADVIYLLP